VLGSLTGKRGLTTAQVDILIDKINPKDYDAIVVVGGQRTFWHNPTIINLLQTMDKQEKVIGAICSSAVLPMQAGLLTGKKGTAFSGDPELAEFKKYSIIYNANPVEVEGNIVTADGPDSARAFAQELVLLLGK